MRRIEPGLSIRTKLAAAFVAVACFVAAFVGLAIASVVGTVERAAQMEAVHVAELVAEATTGGNLVASRLQEYVFRLRSIRKRDVVIVDAAKKGLADADPGDVGKTYDDDPDNEVGQTISDGRTRTFIEKNAAHPDGARQVVVPVRQGPGGPAIGAVLVEYTFIREELFAAERSRLYGLALIGALVVLFAAVFGLGIAKRIAQPLRDLKDSVERISGQDYGARVAVASNDEIGLLAVAFNTMAEDLTASHAAIAEHKRDLEESNSLLKLEVGQRSWEATHDALTGLVNRREFEALVEVAVATAQGAGKNHVVCYMDLDQFKVVNDTCGHAAGDDLLVRLGELLQSRIRQSDTLARLGGDEFALLLEGCPMERAQLIAADLLAAVGDFRFSWDAKTFTVGVSIGLAPVTAESNNTAEALSMADTACYWAKEQGRNRVCVYRTGDSDMAARRREVGWIARINSALADDRFTLYQQSYLPLTNAAGQRNHLEVLVRMIDEKGNLVQPASFLPAAERYNLMPAIDRWVVRKVFAHYHALVAERGGGALTCAINLSGTSVNAEWFLEFVRGEALENALPPHSICFEMTETAVINNLRRASEFIRECKSMGFLFALDDFGTGSSAFGYLKSLPVDYLKIDGEFVKNLERDAVDKAMTESINHIGHIMGIKTIAEFAESPAIIQALRTMGVDYAQGYGVSKPTPLFTSSPELVPLPRAA